MSWIAHGNLTDIVGKLAEEYLERYRNGERPALNEYVERHPECADDIREAKAAARLHHTNIVPVFGVGEQDGLHYYVMQFIQGLGLDEVLVELQHLREQSALQASGGRQPTDSAVGVQPSGCFQQAEACTPTNSAAAVAQSLISGQFERTLLVESESEGTDSPITPLDPQPLALAPPDTAIRLTKAADQQDLT